MQAARRRFRSRLTRGLLVLACLLPATAHAFGFNDVARQARELADERWRGSDSDLPKALRELTYDQYRDIRFRPERALWRNSNLPFEIQFFHPGFIFNEPIKIHLVGENGTQKLPFRPADYDYGANKLNTDALDDVGHAGFRVHFPVNQPQYKDEVAVFLGASYFRALGKDQVYGLSARGLAVDTGLMSGEEFPRFTEFWIVWPPEGARELEIFALLDSRRVTGAYRFVLRPGTETQMEVRARLFFRDSVEKLGIAPLTSMFFFGENQPASMEDYRPEVHDSDGLLLHTESKEWLWRPLVNPERLLVTSFVLENPRGFGLMQRDRDFDHYQDLEARYDRRPSAWVTPDGNWGKGRLELVQIPTPDETNDNIVAYWVPAKQPEEGEAFDFRYRLAWQLKQLTQPPLARVVQARRGHGWRKNTEESLHFIVDFEEDTAKSIADDQKPEAVLWTGDNAEALEKQFFRNEATGGWRVSFKIRRKDDTPVELRLTLRKDGKPLSETWSYVLP